MHRRWVINGPSEMDHCLSVSLDCPNTCQSAGEKDASVD